MRSSLATNADMSTCSGTSLTVFGRGIRLISTNVFRSDSRVCRSMNSRIGFTPVFIISTCEIWPSSHGVIASRFTCVSVGVITKPVNNSAMPASRCAGGALWVPIACLRKCSTIRMRVKPVIMSSSVGSSVSSPIITTMPTVPFRRRPPVSPSPPSFTSICGIMRMMASSVPTGAGDAVLARPLASFVGSTTICDIGRRDAAACAVRAAPLSAPGVAPKRELRFFGFAVAAAPCFIAASAAAAFCTRSCVTLCSDAGNAKSGTPGAVGAGNVADAAGAPGSAGG